MLGYFSVKMGNLGYTLFTLFTYLELSVYLNLTYSCSNLHEGVFCKNMALFYFSVFFSKLVDCEIVLQ